MNAHEILGHVDEQQFLARKIHRVDIGWGDAAKHRQAVTADTGLTVQITLPRGTFLRDGAVIADDGTDIVVVRRPAEDAIVVPFANNSQQRMLMLGYVLGNQHAPIDIGEQAMAAPLLTSAHAAKKLMSDLGVMGQVTAMALARDGWSRTSSDSHAGHHH